MSHSLLAVGRRLPLEWHLRVVPTTLLSESDRGLSGCGKCRSTTSASRYSAIGDKLKLRERKSINWGGLVSTICEQLLGCSTYFFVRPLLQLTRFLSRDSALPFRRTKLDIRTTHRSRISIRRLGYSLRYGYPGPFPSRP